MDLNLDDLIAQVDDVAGSDQPLDRLSAAMGVKDDLDDLADRLIGHFVDQARRSGCSWSEIGAAMGVSKQAAQQRERRPKKKERRPWPRLGRFTSRARAAVREAEDAARDLGHSYIGTEHVLLGLLAVSQGIAGKALTDFGVTREAIVATLTPGSERERSRRPFTPKAKAVIEGAFEEAVALGHNHIGTEHLLLALFRVPDGLAAAILVELGVTEERARADVVDRLARLAS